MDRSSRASESMTLVDGADHRAAASVREYVAADRQSFTPEEVTQVVCNRFGGKRLVHHLRTFAVVEVVGRVGNWVARVEGWPFAGQQGKTPREAVDNYGEAFEVGLDSLTRRSQRTPDEDRLLAFIHSLIAESRPRSEDDLDVGAFLDALARAGDVDDRMSLLFDRTDELIDQNRLRPVEELLTRFSPDRYETEIAIALLTATRRAARLLPARATAYRAIREILSTRHGAEYATELLSGLE